MQPKDSDKIANHDKNAPLARGRLIFRLALFDLDASEKGLLKRLFVGTYKFACKSHGLFSTV